MTKISITFFFLAILGITSVALIAPPSVPPGPVAPYLNGIFPSSSPGVGGSWKYEDFAPNIKISSPLRIKEIPNSEDVLVLSKLGEIWQVNFETQTQKLVLDIKDRSFKLGEAGCVGMVLHYDFNSPTQTENQFIFIYYRSKPMPDGWSEKGFNRLSKFTWDPALETFDPDSEEILIQQYDRSTWHNGGGLFFGKDNFLYLTLGDEGHDFQAESTQSIDRGLFSGILRIDVDNDPTRSHPIRRQPIANANPEQGWGNTFTQGYSIPNDNPWLDESGGILEEFYALGLRNPYSTFYDRETEAIWIADVGSSQREEISKVEKADNLQWPYLEGTFVSETFQKPTNFIGNEKEAFYEYDRSEGSCIIGGLIYRGETYAGLSEKYVFGDYNQKKIFALSGNSSTADPEFQVLMTGFGDFADVLPESPGITGIHGRSNGDILVCISGKDFTEPGKIFRLQQNQVVADPPSRLSELAVFEDLNTMTPILGLIPYSVNTPLWSDHATKDRWIAVPNDGDFDLPSEQITFSNFEEWGFPEGTVFIKHFSLPTTTDTNGPTTKLETRFFVIGEGGKAYGLTYKWNNEGTEAFLLGGGTSRDIDITENGSVVATQTWDFPSRDQCMTCHNENAKYVLGVKTHQLNGSSYYPHIGVEKNQISFFKEIGLFKNSPSNPDALIKSHAIDNAEIDLEYRIRSYLDANCASCHREGGITTVSHDFRLQRTVQLNGIINFPTQSQASGIDRFVIEAGNHQDSELWIRDASLDENRMPSIGRNVVDQMYIDSLAKWIDGLPDQIIPLEELQLFPNPSAGWIIVRIPNHFNLPAKINVYNMAGQVIQILETENYAATISMNQYAAGTYLVQAYSGDELQVKKFVLQ